MRVEQSIKKKYQRYTEAVPMPTFVEKKKKKRGLLGGGERSNKLPLGLHKQDFPAAAANRRQIVAGFAYHPPPLPLPSHPSSPPTPLFPSHNVAGEKRGQIKQMGELLYPPFSTIYPCRLLTVLNPNRTICLIF